MSSLKGPKVASFYTGKTVFITGGTGFLGKTLIEKLLYSCSGIDKMYILVRDKRGNAAHERLARITNTPAFDRLKGSRNEDLKKITVITGDIARPNLGLPDDVLKRLEDEVSIVFHLAATVAFNLRLKDAMGININGTEEVVKLCHRMKKLQAFVHVSTAFSNADRQDIEEKVYPMPVTLEDARHVAEMYSHDDEVISQFLGKKPNTYTFSKALAEDLVMKQCQDLPTAIVRPSIVMSSIKEPCPGWIDTWSGSTGLFVGMPAGVLKVVKGKGSNVTDLVPVDIVTNCLIVVATECHKTNEIKVYNCCTGTSNPITSNYASAIARRVTLRYSLNELPWPFLVFTSSVIIYTLITFILQTIPAFLIDMWCVLTGKKATQLKLQSRLKKNIEVVKFFLMNEWKFSDGNVRNLFKSLSPEDKETFNFDVKCIHWEKSIEDYILGARKYLLKYEK
ncbi:putative fatty acyl-CoA reductase CG5065 [Trichoplusia ni]|uniref:Fatty acyl-CoA reductase n=1 Tax=Trichoplusia ni TaxID=7111 RepID=A0A7E5VXY2_TRINI|nr:putative fatty acyl-CoA reductase CG5065 [Trichoplusia ni]